MAFNVYKIFNKLEFDALELGSKTYTQVLGDLGQKDVLVIKGNLLSIVYEGVMLSIGLNDENPFYMDGYGVFLDENNDVHLGIETE